MELRGFQPGDLEAMYQLDVLCFQKPFRFSRIAMRRFAGAANAMVQLAIEPAAEGIPERLQGFYIVHLEPGPNGLTGYLVTLDVDPDARGKGIATRLMAALEVAAGATGAAAMVLHVFGGNVSAISLYEKLGYEKVGKIHDFYGSGLHALEYQRALQAGSTPDATTPERTVKHGEKSRAS